MSKRVVVTVFAIAVAVLSAAMPAWAGGPGDNPSCVVPNPPGGATALRGTVAVGVQNAAVQANTDADFTLRLSRGGALAFFRVSLNMQVFSISDEGILCHLLNDDQSVAAASTRAAILTTFALPQSSKFFLTDKSLSNSEIQGSVNQWLCNQTFTPTNPPLAPPTSCQVPPRAASMADVVIYVK
jgi:hypothetical protein